MNIYRVMVSKNPEDIRTAIVVAQDVNEVVTSVAEAFPNQTVRVTNLAYVDYAQALVIAPSAVRHPDTTVCEQ